MMESLSTILFILWLLWFFCYGIKVETGGLKFFINGFLHSYTMNEEIEIIVVIEEAKK